MVDGMVEGYTVTSLSWRAERSSRDTSSEQDSTSMKCEKGRDSSMGLARGFHRALSFKNLPLP